MVTAMDTVTVMDTAMAMVMVTMRKTINENSKNGGRFGNNYFFTFQTKHKPSLRV